jgi:single-strand DNA-binding protein
MYEEVELVGRLTADPTMRYTGDGTPVTTITVATSKKISKDTHPNCPAGWKEGYNGRSWELTKFWRVTCWRDLGERVNQYMSKGRTVFVKGETNGEAMNGIQNPRVWEGNDGVPRASYELTARVVRFLGSRNGNGNGQSQETPPPGFERDEGLDDVPF